MLSQDNINTDSKYSNKRTQLKSRWSSIEESIQVDYLVCALSVVCDTPASYQEINSRDDRDQWKLAIEDEIDSLLIN